MSSIWANYGRQFQGNILNCLKCPGFVFCLLCFPFLHSCNCLIFPQLVVWMFYFNMALNLSMDGVDFHCSYLLYCPHCMKNPSGCFFPILWFSKCVMLAHFCKFNLMEQTLILLNIRLLLHPFEIQYMGYAFHWLVNPLKKEGKCKKKNCILLTHRTLHITTQPNT